MTQEEILSRLLSEISNEYDKAVGSFFYDVEKPVSTELETVYGQVEDILKNGFAKTAEGESFVSLCLFDLLIDHSGR